MVAAEHRRLTGEGRARAKAAGKHIGRPPKLTPQQRRKITGETMAELAREYDVGEATIFRALQGPFEAAA
jgi:DNA invertase Pin-like site-specific DNA recombinase